MIKKRTRDVHILYARTFPATQHSRRGQDITFSPKNYVRVRSVVKPTSVSCIDEYQLILSYYFEFNTIQLPKKKPTIRFSFNTSQKLLNLFSTIEKKVRCVFCVTICLLLFGIIWVSLLSRSGYNNGK